MKATRSKPRTKTPQANTASKHAATAKPATEKQWPSWLPEGLPDRQPTREDIDRHNALMKKLASEIHELPADLAINHDYYLHGFPKKQP